MGKLGVRGKGRTKGIPLGNVEHLGKVRRVPQWAVLQHLKQEDMQMEPGLERT